MASATQWITQRLPSDARFSKHGIVQSVAQAVADALSVHIDRSEFARERLALADLLEILRSDIVYKEQHLMDWSGRDEVLTERISSLREEADNEKAGSGGFGFVPASFGNAAPKDEFTA
jgi:hypothetical protein